MRSFSSSARAAAGLPARNCGPPLRMVLLPTVRPWSTVLRGVSHGHGDSCEGHVQFLRHDLRQRRPRARADVNLPVNMVMLPSGITASQESSSFGSR